MDKGSKYRSGTEELLQDAQEIAQMDGINDAEDQGVDSYTPRKSKRANHENGTYEESDFESDWTFEDKNYDPRK